MLVKKKKKSKGLKMNNLKIQTINPADCPDLIKGIIERLKSMMVVDEDCRLLSVDDVTIWKRPTTLEFEYDYRGLDEPNKLAEGDECWALIRLWSNLEAKFCYINCGFTIENNEPGVWIFDGWYEGNELGTDYDLGYKESTKLIQ